MTAFEMPTVVTARRRAFHAGDLDADAAVQAHPEPLRHPLTDRAAACGAG
jgi:hypothetical protein